MRSRILIAIIIFLFLSTFSFQQKIVISKFNLKEISVENNFLLKEKDIKKLLTPLYNKNLIFLEYSEIKKLLKQITFIDSFNIKKKYPNQLEVKIFEKKPIAILLNKKKKFYLSEKLELIEFRILPDYQNLPYVIGNKNDFKILYNNLFKVDFPFKEIKKYIFYETNRWDIETKNKNLIKLPPLNYTESLKNYLSLKDQSDFKKYKVFDYRINNQLILK